MKTRLRPHASSAGLQSCLSGRVPTTALMFVAIALLVASAGALGGALQRYLVIDLKGRRLCLRRASGRLRRLARMVVSTDAAYRISHL